MQRQSTKIEETKERMGGILAFGTENQRFGSSLEAGTISTKFGARSRDGRVRGMSPVHGDIRALDSATDERKRGECPDERVRVCTKDLEISVPVIRRRGLLRRSRSVRTRCPERFRTATVSIRTTRVALHLGMSTGAVRAYNLSEEPLIERTMLWILPHALPRISSR